MTNALDKKNNWVFEKTTLMVKTFQRPQCLDRLLKSIDHFYGGYGKDVKIIIGDDSSQDGDPLRIRNEVVYYKLPFDTGSGATRNFLLDQIDTEYFLYLDDDFVFNSNTRFQDLIIALEQNQDIDILAGCNLDNGVERRDFYGLLTPSDQKGYLDFKRREHKGTRMEGCIKIVDLIENFWAGRTEKVKQVKWRSELKTLEHVVFLVDCMFFGLTLAQYSTITIDHYRELDEAYASLRFRYKDLTFLDDMLRESYGIQLDPSVY